MFRLLLHPVVQCDQVGWFFNVLGVKYFLTKLAQMLTDLFSLLLKMTLFMLNSNCSGYILSNLWINFGDI